MHNNLELMAWMNRGYAAANANPPAPVAGTWQGQAFRIGLACKTASMIAPSNLAIVRHNTFVFDNDRLALVAANGTVTLDATVS